MKGFKNFMMQGDLIVISVGLVVALSFSTLIKSFTDNVVTPLVNALAGGGKAGVGVGWTINGQRIDLGSFISAIIYFVIFMAVIYYVIVVPYRAFMHRRGTTVFGEPAPSKTCPSCLSAGIPVAATKCKFCTSDLTV
ncbi:MAG TPA: MscL family protein [Acidimicrobiales bacterium]|nr:MscL family protein [Acidimicrobiales bacterium]